KAVFFHAIPAVERIPPELARWGEQVRRNSRDLLGPSILAQGEELRARPHVRAVVRDVDRHVANDRDASAVSLVSDASPLSKKKKLEESLKGDFAAHLDTGFSDRAGIAPGETRRPGAPASRASSFERRKESPIA